MVMESRIRFEAENQFRADYLRFKQTLALPKTERNRSKCEKLFIRMDVNSALLGASAFQEKLSRYRAYLDRYSQDLSALNPATLANVASISPHQAADEGKAEDNDDVLPQRPLAIQEGLLLRFPKALEPFVARTTVRESFLAEPVMREVSLNDSLPNILSYVADEDHAAVCKEFANVYHNTVFPFLNKQLEGNATRVQVVLQDMRALHISQLKQDEEDNSEDSSVDSSDAEEEQNEIERLYQALKGTPSRSQLYKGLADTPVLSSIRELPNVQFQVSGAMLTLYLVFSVGMDARSQEQFKQRLVETCAPLIRSTFDKVKDIKPFESRIEAKNQEKGLPLDIFLMRAQVTLPYPIRRAALFAILNTYRLKERERRIILQMIEAEPDSNKKKQLLGSFLQKYKDPFERFEMCQKLNLPEEIKSVAFELYHTCKNRLPELYQRWKQITDPQFRAKMAEIVAPQLIAIGRMKESHEMFRCAKFQNLHFNCIIRYAWMHHRLPELIARDSELSRVPYEPILMSLIVRESLLMVREGYISLTFAANIQEWAHLKNNVGRLAFNPVAEEVKYLFIKALLKRGKKKQALKVYNDMAEGPLKAKGKAVFFRTTNGSSSTRLT